MIVIAFQRVPMPVRSAMKALQIPVDGGIIGSSWIGGFGRAMGKQVIDAKAALDDIRAGMNDAALMEKYNLSVRGLQSLYSKLEAEGLLDRFIFGNEPSGPQDHKHSEKKELSAKKALADLKKGLSDQALMEKYRLSGRGLQSMFTKLLEAKLVDESGLERGAPGLKRKIKRLFESGADPNAQTFFGFNALALAAGEGDVTLLEALLARGADVNRRFKNGETALMNACRWARFDAVVFLLDEGADVNVRDEEGLTPLMCAAAAGDRRIVELLLARGTEIDAQAENGVTALMLAASENSLEVVESLVDSGADVDLKEHEGATALMMAAHAGHVEVVELLLDSGANMNCRDSHGKTALGWAIENSHEEVREVLLERGARR